MAVGSGAQTPAHRLQIGSKLDQWEIVEKVMAQPGSSGGMFSVGYIVRDDAGRTGFLKALDFEPLIKSPTTKDPVRMLQGLLEAFNFERDLVDLCKSMDRVVSGFTDGTTTVDSMIVPYIIFERAGADLRTAINHSAALDLALALRVMHHVSVGMLQLHSKSVAHQDLKPSNVMMFENYSKVGDLGRATRLGRPSVYDGHAFAGDKTYAPPELLYGYTEPDWRKRRLGSDLYQVGCLLSYLILGQGTTVLLIEGLNSAHRPAGWKGSFAEVLPYLKASFHEVQRQFADALPVVIRDELTTAFRQLCEPDPEARGHPTNRRQGTPYSLERYHPLFDRLATKVRLNITRKASS